MNINELYEVIPSVVEDVKKEYIIQNIIPKDNIFKILEKHCVVVYYPIEDESKNRGFHIKRFIDGELRDFVYINTAKSTAEQVFAAAHELGHVWRVAEKIWKIKECKEVLSEDIEEKLVSRFAAEFLMPREEFTATFTMHMNELGFNPRKIRLDEIVRVMAMQMTDYMVPYEAVRRRMLETWIITEPIADVLCKDMGYINGVVSTYLGDQNTTLEAKSMKKTIPGLRDLINKAEIQMGVSEYALAKLKADFAIVEVGSSDQIINITAKE